MSDPRTPGDTGNPFTAQRIRPGALPYQFPDGVTAETLVTALAGHGWRGAITGPHGSGKSTLLRALEAQLAAVGRNVVLFELRDGQRRMPSVPAGVTITPRSIIVVDGYEQLSHWSRLQLRYRCWRTGCGLLVTAHQAVGLPTLFVTRTNAQLAVAIVRSLEAERSGSSPISSGDIERAYASHSGNVREMLFTLYDLYRQRIDSGAPSA
jgi:hypothetical protein